MRWKVKALRDQAGQATIEFALTLILLMGFMLFFVQITFVFAWGNYVHYATFMSARAYLAAGPSLADQRERANAVAVRMLKKGGGAEDRLPFVAKGEGQGPVKGLAVGPGDQYADGDRGLSWMDGVRYTFKSRLFMLPLGGGGDKTANSVTLTSESWLGREPAYDECRQEMIRMKGIYDNGC
jgi:hypothetical protein